MKKHLLLALLLSSSLPIFAQSVFQNAQIQYELQLQEFWSSANNDNATLDDLVLKWEINAVPSNNFFSRCEFWTCDAPCSTIKSPSDPDYHFGNNSAAFTERLEISFEGWENDEGANCTLDSGDDFVMASVIPALRNGGFVAGSGETQSRWEGVNSAFETEFLFFQNLNFDMRYRIAWRYVHGEDINDPLQFGSLGHGTSITTGGTNRSEVEFATNQELGWKDNGGQNTADTYYQFTLTHHSRVLISTDILGRTYDTYLTLYGADQAKITEDDDSGTLGDGAAAVIDIVLAPGTYFINVEGSDAAILDEKTGEYLLRLQVDLINNEPCKAIEIPANGQVQNGYSNEKADVSGNEPLITPAAGDCFTAWCDVEAGPRLQHSIWFKFIAPASGAVEVSTCNLANFDTQIALYDVPACSNYLSYTLIGANDDGINSGQDCSGFTSLLKQQGLIPGNTYFILVDGYEAEVGDLGIKVTQIQSTGLEQLEASKEVLLVSPNPSNGWLNLKLKGEYKMEAYTLSDLSGKAIQSAQFGQSQAEEDLDLSTLPKGIYLLQVRSGNQIFTQKVVIQ